MRWNAIFFCVQRIVVVLFFSLIQQFLQLLHERADVGEEAIHRRKAHICHVVCCFQSSITMSPMRWEEISPSMLA